MSEKKQEKMIYGYMFAILTRQGENGGWIASCPGVGGVYEEGDTLEQAKANAYDGASAILSSRIKDGKPLIKESQFLKILTEPPNINKIPRKDDQNYITTVPPTLCNV